MKTTNSSNKVSSIAHAKEILDKSNILDFFHVFNDLTVELQQNKELILYSTAIHHSTAFVSCAMRRFPFLADDRPFIVALAKESFVNINLIPERYKPIYMNDPEVMRHTLSQCGSLLGTTHVDQSIKNNPELVLLAIKSVDPNIQERLYNSCAGSAIKKVCGDNYDHNLTLQKISKMAIEMTTTTQPKPTSMNTKKL